MAGYFLYSLDWTALESFLQSPSSETVRQLAEQISDLLDDYDDDLEEDDPVAAWPSDVEGLVPIVTEHLANDNWYSGLSRIGGEIWEQAFTGICLDEEGDAFGFQCESDGVYWNIIEETIKHHGQPNDRLTEMEITHFGTRPLRYWRDGKLKWDEDFSPTHSMHTPEEVAKLIEQFEAAEPTLRKSRHDEVEEDYETLMPVLDKLKSESRVLYVSVDT